MPYIYISRESELIVYPCIPVISAINTKSCASRAATGTFTISRPLLDLTTIYFAANPPKVCPPRSSTEVPKSFRAAPNPLILCCQIPHAIAPKPKSQPKPSCDSNLGLDGSHEVRWRRQPRRDDNGDQRQQRRSGGRLNDEAMAN